MNQNPIKVIVESLPSSIYSELLPWFVGIILPIAVLLVSKIYSNKAERSANKFTINLHKEERRHFQKIRASELLNEIYKATYNIKRINLQQKRMEKHEVILAESNDKIISSGNEIAILLHQENMRTLHLRNEELNDSKSDHTINIHSAIGLLSTIIGDNEVQSLNKKIQLINKKENEVNGITNELAEDITNEINTLSERVINEEIQI
jgi:hypothetical protein